MFMEKIKKIVTLCILLISASAYSSSISFMIKNDGVTESYIKLKNEKDTAYLKLYCNNVFNDVQVSIEGLDEKQFYNKNYHSSKTIFGTNFTNSRWRVDYDKENNFHLMLDDEGLSFSKRFYEQGSVLIDMEGMNSIKLFNVSNKSHLQEKLSSVLENCSIYF